MTLFMHILRIALLVTVVAVVVSFFKAVGGSFDRWDSRFKGKPKRRMQTRRRGTRKPPVSTQQP